MSDNLIRALCLAGAALLVGTKLWAGLTGDLAATMAAAGHDPWGIVALIALYAGIAAFAIVMIAIERDRRVVIGVLIALPLIGNAAPALWLAWRGLPLLRRR